jgi:hypothetical protein
MQTEFPSNGQDFWGKRNESYQFRGSTRWRQPTGGNPFRSSRIGELASKSAASSVSARRGQASSVVAHSSPTAAPRQSVVGPQGSTELPPRVFSVENSLGCLALEFMNQEGACHQTLRIPPGMAAGLRDHVWSLEEIVNDGRLLRAETSARRPVQEETCGIMNLVLG